MSDTSGPPQSATPDGLDRIFAPPPGRARRLRLALLLGLLVAGAGAWWWMAGGKAPPTVGYRTEPLTRDTLVVKVSATGNLVPTTQVEVGSELSGIVRAVLVEDDDRVSRGQVLAELDMALFEDAVNRSRAAVAVAEAGLKQAEASLAEASARLARFEEVRELSGGKVPSATEMDTAEANLARARADAASAKAAIAQARALLRSEQTNLERCRIRSPIDGVVLERAVEPGQTVAASLQAVTLFTLAEDLSRMELRVDVDEADVGQVRPDQEVSFTVDAWPGRRFEARIVRVGFNAKNEEGVVSYPAVLSVDNSDLSLRPGMTGTAEITVLTREDALLVPNAALRFTPPAEAEAEAGRGVMGVLMPRMPRPPPPPAAPLAAADGSREIWTLVEGEARPLRVRTGATDGRRTELLEGAPEPGTEVIVEALRGPP